jgi:hypothetical protein
MLLYGVFVVAATAFIGWELLARHLPIPSVSGWIGGAVASFVLGGRTGPRVQPQDPPVNPLHAPRSAPRRPV